MIIESIVTTLNEKGELNVAPMGAVVDGPEFDFFELRPFKSSTTFTNLLHSHQGVLHITDDIRLFAHAALGLESNEFFSSLKKTIPAQLVQGQILTSCCRCYEFRVQHSDTASNRTSFACRVERIERFRDFTGFNRARHAIIEATILATRIDFIPQEEILSQIERLRLIVEKTGGEEEFSTMKQVESFLDVCFTTSTPKNSDTY